MSRPPYPPRKAALLAQHSTAGRMGGHNREPRVVGGWKDSKGGVIAGHASARVAGGKVLAATWQGITEVTRAREAEAAAREDAVHASVLLLQASAQFGAIPRNSVQFGAIRRNSAQFGAIRRAILRAILRATL